MAKPPVRMVCFTMLLHNAVPPYLGPHSHSQLPLRRAAVEIGAQSSRPACPASSGVREARFADVHAAGDFLVIVATDRLSAFDYILPTPIPDKGRVLTALTIFSLDLLKDVVPDHFVSADVADYPPQFHPYRDQLEGRSMLVHRA